MLKLQSRKSKLSTESNTLSRELGLCSTTEFLTLQQLFIALCLLILSQKLTSCLILVKVYVRRTDMLVVGHLLVADIKQNLKGCLCNLGSQYIVGILL